MNYAIIENGVVINVAVAEEALAENWVASEVAAIGDFYENGQFIKQAPDANSALTAFQEQRAAKLAATDWWAIRASEPGGIPMTEEQLAYRQALRSMDDAEDFDPLNPNWPEEPNA